VKFADLARSVRRSVIKDCTVDLYRPTSTTQSNYARTNVYPSTATTTGIRGTVQSLEGTPRNRTEQEYGPEDVAAMILICDSDEDIQPEDRVCVTSWFGDSVAEASRPWFEVSNAMRLSGHLQVRLERKGVRSV